MNQLEEARALLNAPKVDIPVASTLPLTDASHKRLVLDDDISDDESVDTIDDPVAVLPVQGVLPVMSPDVPVTPTAKSSKSSKPDKPERTTEEQLKLKKRAEAARARRAEKKRLEKAASASAPSVPQKVAPTTPPTKGATPMPEAPRKKKRTSSDAFSDSSEDRITLLNRLVKKRFVGKSGKAEDAASFMRLVNETHCIGEAILALQTVKEQMVHELQLGATKI